MTALEKIKQVYGLCTKMEDREWLEEGFSRLEIEARVPLSDEDKMVIAQIRDRMLGKEGSIFLTGAGYHHLAAYLRILYPEYVTDTWPSLNMMLNFSNADSAVVFTEEWRELSGKDKRFWKNGMEVLCLFNEGEAGEVWNRLVYEGFIPEEKIIALGKKETENLNYLIWAKYAPVECEKNTGLPEAAYKKIYALSPAGLKSGGPELMHQLVYHLSRMGADAYIVYLEKNSDEVEMHCPWEFLEYVCGRVRNLNEIDTSSENALVIPEVWPFFLDRGENIKKIFWWMSVDNFKKTVKDELIILNELEQKTVKCSDLMLYQSEYARRYALSIGADEKKLKHLGDYLNQNYIENNEDFLKLPKDRIVAYNPLKGREFTEKLIKAGDDITWVPIENMSTIQVRDLLCKARVYIDFGEHPGKDRIPREAAMCGCCVVTGRRGSAAFNEDVCIPERYRIDEKNTSVGDILDIIRSLLNDYSEKIDDYKEYRTGILSERDSFIKDLKDVFFSKENG